ncbi:MAG: PAS domain S-box protein [Pseudanabaenaceae cyanobacterium bins.39]|nr:PAS domain S-box protein [Pseudanabaenaceae cyanobacterium bins.39]
MSTTLQSLENKHKALISALPDLVARLSGDGIYLDFSPSSECLSFGNYNLVGKSIYDTSINQEIADQSIYHIQQALQTGELQIYEQTVKIGDRLHTEEVRIIASDELEVLMIVRDITERKQTEIALQKSKERLRSSEYLLNAMFMESAVAIAITDINGKFVRTNPCYQKIVGYSEQELQHLRFTDITLNDDISENLRLRDLVLNNQRESYQMEKRFVRRDGQLVWVKATSSKIEQHNGEPPFFIGVLEDISERKQAEESLQSLVEGAAAKTGENFLPALSEYVSRVLNVRCVLVNKLIEDQLQILAAWIDGQMQPMQPLAIANTPCAMTIRNGSFHCCDLVNENFAEHLLLVQQLGVTSYFGVAINNNKGERIGSLCVLDDKPIRDYDRVVAILRVFAARVGAEIERQEAIDALYKLNQELETRVAERTQALQTANHQLTIANAELARATKLKDEFLANMSHELRTPLNAILGISEGLLSNVFGELNERQKRSLSLVESSGKHLLELINDILDVAKIESGKFELLIDSVAIANLCNSSLAFVKQLANQKQIRLETLIPNDLGKISIDERRMRQSLINLLSNAVKFTPKGGKVSLSVKVVPASDTNLLQKNNLAEAVVFDISDTGIGITTENINKLFQAFTQIDSSLSRQYAGTGLGLKIVKEIVEMHGGYVHVASQIGQGSCFSIILPYVQHKVDACLRQGMS